MSAILELAHGIHEGIPESVYHQPELGMASVSALTEFSLTPSKYRAMIAGTRKRTETPALSFGRALHMALLEPAKFKASYLIEPDFGDCRKTANTTSEQAKENKTRRDAWRAAHAGATLLEGKEGERLLGMVGRIAERRPSDPNAASLLEGGKCEVTLRWKDPRTGLECRARADCWQSSGLLGSLVLDPKSTTDASEEGFNRAIGDYDFHWIEAFYRSGFRALGQDISDYIFLMQEKEPPYDFSLNRVPPDDVLLGIASTERLMDRLAECLARDEWPGYSSHIYTGKRKAWIQE